MHQGKWNRFFGKRLEEVTVGIICAGRIGTCVLKRWKGFGTRITLINDIIRYRELDSEFKLEWTNKDRIYKKADVISLHLTLNHLTKNMIRKEHLLKMKSDAVLINTSRGGIINELELYEVM